MDNENQIPHNPKITTMYDLLSGERKSELSKFIVETITNFRNSGKLQYETIYPLEITKAFDQEEPKQFIYVRCAFKVYEKPVEDVINLFGVNDFTKAISTPTIPSIRMILEDVEVFNEDNIFEWLDHVNRINKQNSENKDNQLFYENNIFKDDSDTEKEQIKIEPPPNLS